MAKIKKKYGCTRKCGRTERKANARVKPLSLFVRGRISAKEYFSLTGQSFKG